MQSVFGNCLCYMESYLPKIKIKIKHYSRRITQLWYRYKDTIKRKIKICRKLKRIHVCVHMCVFVGKQRSLYSDSRQCECSVHWLWCFPKLNHHKQFATCKSCITAGQWCPMLLIPALRRQKQEDFCSFHANLLYRVRSRTVKAIIQRIHFKKNKINKKENKY